MLRLRDGYLDASTEAQTCKVRLADAVAEQQPVIVTAGVPPWLAVTAGVVGAVLGGLVVYELAQ